MDRLFWRTVLVEWLCQDFESEIIVGTLVVMVFCVGDD